VPENFKLRNGTSKYLLKESMRDELPPIVYNRKYKLGLPGPEEPLFKSQLSNISACYKELIQNYPGIFSDKLLTLLHNYGEEKIPYHNFLFRVLSFAAWAKQFNVSSCISQKRRRSNYELVGEQIKGRVTSY
jgi:asparagine synthase (glutamine-hydrolysing)